MKIFKLLYTTLVFAMLFPTLSYCAEVRLEKMSGDIELSEVKQYKFNSYIRKSLFDEQLNITNVVTRKITDFYGEKERIVHTEPVNGRYGNVYFSGNKKFYAVINYSKRTRMTNIEFKNENFETIWDNSFKFLSTRRVYISNDGKSLIHYGISLTGGFASITFIDEAGEIAKKKSHFKYVKDSYEYSPVTKVFIVHGNTAYDSKGQVLWRIGGGFDKLQGESAFSHDGSNIVAIFKSGAKSEGDILFLDNHGKILSKKHLERLYDTIIKFSYDNEHCIIYTAETVYMFNVNDGALVWRYDLRTYKDKKNIDLIAFSLDTTERADRIAISIIPRRMGIYLNTIYLIIFNHNGAIVSEHVINDANKVSKLPPLLFFARDGKQLSLKFDKMIIKYSLTP